MAVEICSKKGAGPFCNKGQNKENFDKSLKKNLLMNHWWEYIDIWYGASLGRGDSNLFK